MSARTRTIDNSCDPAAARPRALAPVYVATMSSESFDWTAAGDTEDAARAALLEAFNTSALNLGGYPFDSADAMAEHYGITVKPLAPGIVYRDDTIMREADEAPGDARSANR